MLPLSKNAVRKSKRLKTKEKPSRTMVCLFLMLAITIGTMFIILRLCLYDYAIGRWPDWICWILRYG